MALSVYPYPFVPSPLCQIEYAGQRPANEDAINDEPGMLAQLTRDLQQGMTVYRIVERSRLSEPNPMVIENASQNRVGV
jgi:hypothetical protein